MIVTPMYAGLLGLWFLVLSLRVVHGRWKFRINLGDGANPAMTGRVRGHANFAEYVPLILLLIAILELSRFSIYLLHALGATLLLARVLHGIGLAFSERFMLGRAAGILLTFLVLLIAAVLCVWQGLRAATLMT